MSDNFTQLWASFREQVQAARTAKERPSIYTAGENSMTQQDGALIDIWEPSMMETPPSSVFSVRSRLNALRFQVHAEDCIAIAAQLMAVAEEMQDAKPHPSFNASAHGHLLTERIPADDEHP